MGDHRRRGAVLPAAEHNPNPIEREAPNRRWVVLAAPALLFVVSPSPTADGDSVSCPFVKRQREKLQTGPAEENPLALFRCVRGRPAGVEPAQACAGEGIENREIGVRRHGLFASRRNELESQFNGRVVCFVGDRRRFVNRRHDTRKARLGRFRYGRRFVPQ